ncbi:MAG TPA: hypothetical protein VFA60_09245 [Terriglobales bacterium]|nr:hypothetical protein [Terriglobales bacterium]
MKLKVRPEDAGQAREVLASAPPLIMQDSQTGGFYQQPACPRCNSFDIAFGDRSAGIKLVALQAGIPLPSFQEPHWRCAECGARWVEE